MSVKRGINLFFRTAAFLPFFILRAILFCQFFWYNLYIVWKGDAWNYVGYAEKKQTIRNLGGSLKRYIPVIGKYEMEGFHLADESNDD